VTSVLKDKPKDLIQYGVQFFENPEKNLYKPSKKTRPKAGYKKAIFHPRIKRIPKKANFLEIQMSNESPLDHDAQRMASDAQEIPPSIDGSHITEKELIADMLSDLERELTGRLPASNFKSHRQSDQGFVIEDRRQSD